MATTEPTGITWNTDRDFRTVDYILFVLSLCLSLGIGIWAAVSGGGQKTTSEYHTGNRSLNPLAVGMSILMSFISAILVLSNTAEMYLWGVQWWMQIWGSCLAYIYIVVMFVPFFYKKNLTSSFEYFDTRFKNKIVRYTGDIFLVIYQVLYMGTSMVAPAIALETAIGFDQWLTFVISGVVATIYTVIGGMKAVVWTDFIQGFIYLGGVLIILIVGIVEVGGLGEVFSIADDYGRLDFFQFDPNPAVRLSFWPVVVGTFAATLHTVGVAQTSVQRYCAVATLNQARFTVLMIAPAVILMFTLTCGIGLTIFAYYAKEGCDPIRSGGVENSNALLPVFLIDVIDIPCLGGLFLSVLFSGALSTLSSSMSALSAVIWKDVLEPRYYYFPESKKANISKLLALVFGVMGVAAAFLIANVDGPIAEASTGLVSGVGGPLLAMFLLGMYWPWANAIGTALGGWIGLGVVLWCSYGYYTKAPWLNFLDTNVENCANVDEIPPIGEDLDIFPMYKISFLWYSALGTGVTMFFGIIISFITGPTDPKSLPPDQCIPMFEKLFCCLPSSIQKKLYCGVDYDEEHPETWEHNVVKKDEDKHEESNGDIGVEKGMNGDVGGDDKGFQLSYINPDSDGHTNQGFTEESNGKVNVDKL